MKFSWNRKKAAEQQQRLETAQQQLADVRGRWPAVRRAAASMERHLERNGFADAIRTAMGVREP